MASGIDSTGGNYVCLNVIRLQNVAPKTGHLHIRVTYRERMEDHALSAPVTTSTVAWNHTFRLPVEFKEAAADMEGGVQVQLMTKKKTLGEVLLPLSDIPLTTAFAFAKELRVQLNHPAGKKQKNSKKREPLPPLTLTVKVGYDLQKKSLAAAKGSKKEKEAQARELLGPLGTLTKDGLTDTTSGWDELSTDEILAKANIVAQASVESSARSAEIAEKLVVMADDAHEALVEQDGQIKRIAGEVGEVLRLQDQADVHLRGISSAPGAVFNKVTKAETREPRQFNVGSRAEKEIAKKKKQKMKEQKHDERAAAKAGKKGRGLHLPYSHKRSRSRGDSPRAGGGVSSSAPARMSEMQVLEVLDEETKEKLDETEDNLDRVARAVGHIKERAEEIGELLDEQNERLSELDKATKFAHEREGRLRDRTKGMARRGRLGF